MAFFRLVQGVSRPMSYPVEPGSELYRGQIGFKTVKGTITNSASAGCMIAGIIDDDKATSLYDKFIGSYTFTATTNNSDDALSAQTIATGILNFREGINNKSMSDYPSWSLVAKVAGASGGYNITVDSSKVTVALDKDTGIITLSIDTGTDLEAATTYDFKLTIAADVKRSMPGAMIASDMFNNESTLASGLATVWFLEGIYETDQYDPYQVYAINDPLYVTNSGIITSNESDSVADANGNKIIIGYVEKAPSATYTAETRVVSGHLYPKPEALRIRYIAPTAIIG